MDWAVADEAGWGRVSSRPGPPCPNPASATVQATTGHGLAEIGMLSPDLCLAVPGFVSGGWQARKAKGMERRAKLWPLCPHEHP